MGEDEGTTQKTEPAGLEELLQKMRAENASEATIAAVRALATARSIPISTEPATEAKTVDDAVEATPEPEPPPEPPEPAREQRLDRDYILEARPDLFERCKDDYGKKCKASIIVTAMSGSKGLEEQAERYKRSTRWHYADDEARIAAIKSWLGDNHPKDKPKPPEPAPKLPSLKQMIEQESKNMKGVPELPGWKLIELTREWREIEKVSKHLNPTGEGKSRRYPLKNVEAEAPARQAVKELVYDLRTDLTVTMDYVESDFSGVFRDCKNDREYNALKKEVEAAIYEDRSVAEQEMEFHGTTRHIKTGDEDTKNRIEDILWEKYLKDMPEKPEDDEDGGEPEPEEPEPEPARELVLDRDYVLEARPDVVKNYSSESNKKSKASMIASEMSGSKGLEEQAEHYRNTRRWHFADDEKRKAAIDRWLQSNYPAVEPEPDIPEPEEPPEPAREQRVDRNYILEARPDLFERCISENARKCKASTIASKMSGSKGLEEQIESYRTTRRWHFADDEKRTAAMDKWLEKHYPETEPEPKSPAKKPAERKPTYRPAKRYTSPQLPAAKPPARRAYTPPAGSAPLSTSARDVIEEGKVLLRGAPARISPAPDLSEKIKEARKAGVPKAIIKAVERRFTLGTIAELYAGHTSDQEREDLGTIFRKCKKQADYDRCIATLKGQSLPSAHPAYHCLSSSASNFEKGVAYLLSQIEVREKRDRMSPMERHMARKERMGKGFW
jgi:hypothetical protein